jgi:hypothetical protein
VTGMKKGDSSIGKTVNLTAMFAKVMEIFDDANYWTYRGLSNILVWSKGAEKKFGYNNWQEHQKH